MYETLCSNGIQRERGASLLEVLIAVVVLSIGLLGMAGLQVATLRVNQGAMVRSQATGMAYDMLDRVRGNTAAARGGAYDIALGEAATGSGTVAAADLAEWKGQLAISLPGGDGSVCRRGDATPDDPAALCEGAGEFIVVRLQWTEADDNNQARVPRTTTVIGQL